MIWCLCGDEQKIVRYDFSRLGQAPQELYDGTWRLPLSEIRLDEADP